MSLRAAALRERVCEANLGLVRAGLVVLSFGNASGVDRDAGLLAIKPSGIDYLSLRPADIVLVDLEDGRIVDGGAPHSTDTPTHRLLYQSFATVGGIVHTHSAMATAWAQAGREIECLGTTHADHFRGPVPVTRSLTDEEIAGEYEANTGRVIVERFVDGRIDPELMPACLVVSHGPFVWGHDPAGAVQNAIALEHVAVLAFHTAALTPSPTPIASALLDRHFCRKHGTTAYYGDRGARRGP
jgi:L-ribulose-5-phosphate 4-epimerase